MAELEIASAWDWWWLWKFNFRLGDEDGERVCRASKEKGDSTTTGLVDDPKPKSRCFRDTYPEPSSSNVLRLLCADGCCGYRDGSRSKRRFRSVLIPFLWNSQIFRSRLQRQIQGDQRVGFSRRCVGRRRRMRYFGWLAVNRESHSIEQVVLFLLKINLESKVFEND